MPLNAPTIRGGRLHERRRQARQGQRESARNGLPKSTARHAAGLLARHRAVTGVGRQSRTVNFDRTISATLSETSTGLTFEGASSKMNGGRPRRFCRPISSRSLKRRDTAIDINMRAIGVLEAADPYPRDT